MTFSLGDRLTLTLTLMLPVSALLWLLMWHEIVTPGTMAGIMGLLIAAAGITLSRWKSGQATGSVSQLIHETNETRSSQSAEPAPPVSTSASRWDEWERRGEALARTGHVQALLALSVALTGLLLYAGLA